MKVTLTPDQILSIVKENIEESFGSHAKTHMRWEGDNIIVEFVIPNKTKQSARQKIDAELREIMKTGDKIAAIKHLRTGSRDFTVEERREFPINVYNAHADATRDVAPDCFGLAYSKIYIEEYLR